MNTSETILLTGPGHLPKKARAIAENHDATLVNYTDPQCNCGRGCAISSCPRSRRHWFAARNMGEPFNGRKSAAIISDLENAGLLSR